MERTSVIVAVIGCLLVLTPVARAQGESPARRAVREVKYNAGVNEALQAIEKEACEHYETTGEFRVFQERRNPRPRDVRTVNFGYSCPHPDNDRGGWLYLPPISEDLSSLVGATEQAKENGATHPKAGQVIADGVYLSGSQKFFRKEIFPAYLPDDPSREYRFWTYDQHKENPLRMQIYKYGEHDPGPKCPRGLRLGTLDGQVICYQAADDPPPVSTESLAWQGDTVFENYPQIETESVSMQDHTPVMVDAPVITEDHWTYKQ